MTVKSTRNINGFFVVVTCQQTPLGLVLICVGDCHAEVIHVNHNHRLKQVSEDSITKNSATRFHLQTTAPSRLIRINLVSQAGFAVLPVEHRTANLVTAALASL